MKKEKMIYLKSLGDIPKFKNENEEAKFWDTHSVSKIMNQMEPVNLTVSHGLKKKIELRHKAKKLISLRIEGDKIDSLKEVASKKGIGYLTLIRMWVIEKLAKETRYWHVHR